MLPLMRLMRINSSSTLSPDCFSTCLRGLLEILCTFDKQRISEVLLCQQCGHAFR